MAVHSEETLHYLRLAFESEREVMHAIAAENPMNIGFYSEVHQSMQVIARAMTEVEGRFVKRRAKRKSK